MQMKYIARFFPPFCFPGAKCFYMQLQDLFYDVKQQQQQADVVG